jgi:phospholipase C
MTDQIKHIVVLVLENRSFDHMLGDLQQDNRALDGIDRDNPKSNSYEESIEPDNPKSSAFEERTYVQEPGAARFVSPDPMHEYEHVLRQIKNNNSGFVRDFAEAHPHATDEERKEVMRCTGCQVLR